MDRIMKTPKEFNDVSHEVRHITTEMWTLLKRFETLHGRLAEIVKENEAQNEPGSDS